MTSGSLASVHHEVLLAFVIGKEPRPSAEPLAQDYRSGDAGVGSEPDTLQVPEASPKDTAELPGRGGQPRGRELCPVR